MYCSCHLAISRAHYSCSKMPSCSKSACFTVGYKSRYLCSSSLQSSHATWRADFCVRFLFSRSGMTFPLDPSNWNRLRKVDENLSCSKFYFKVCRKKIHEEQHGQVLLDKFHNLFVFLTRHSWSRRGASETSGAKYRNCRRFLFSYLKAF